MYTVEKMKVSKLDLSELLDSEEVIAGVLNDALQSNDSAVLMRTIGYVAKARGVAETKAAYVAHRRLKP